MTRPVSLTCGLSLCFVLAMAASATMADRTPDRLAGLTAVWKACGVPQVGIFGDVTTVIANQAKTIYYRRGAGPWATTPFEFNGTHALTRLPNGRWLVVDTENHRLVQLNDLGSSAASAARSELAGVTPKRPHDVIVDPASGDVYVVAGDRRLFRFTDLEGPIDVWTFTPEEMGYVRALSWFDGRLHLASSSRGEVIRIEDFAQRRYTRFRSPRPSQLRGLPSTQLSAADSRNDFDAGALSTTGLILNDVDKFGDWYYGTNDFLVSHALGADTRPARLIRWKTWDDFERGKWQDLSERIPNDDTPLVPYFITIHDGVLYTPVSRTADDMCEHSKILQLDLKSLPR